VHHSSSSPTELGPENRECGEEEEEEEEDLHLHSLILTGLEVEVWLYSGGWQSRCTWIVEEEERREAALVGGCTLHCELQNRILIFIWKS
jgi:hypothetical protein